VHSRSAGFTLFEMLIVIAVIAFMAAMILPRLGRRDPKAEWSHLVNTLNNIVYFTRQQAISDHKEYRLRFQRGREEQPIVVTIEEERPDPDKPGTLTYQQSSFPTFPARHELHPSFRLRGVYQTGVDQLEENKGNAYCYIVSNGLVQETMIHMAHVVARVEKQMTLKVKPFFGRFELHKGFVKPKRKKR